MALNDGGGNTRVFSLLLLKVASKLSALVCDTGCVRLSRIAADNRSDHSLWKKKKMEKKMFA